MRDESGRCYHHLANCRLFWEIVHRYYLQMQHKTLHTSLRKPSCTAILVNIHYNCHASFKTSVQTGGNWGEPSEHVISVQLGNGKCIYMSAPPGTLMTLMTITVCPCTMSLHCIVWCVTVADLQSNGSVTNV